RGGVLWVGFGREATDVARVDPASGDVARVAVGVKAPSHFLAAANAIWVVNDGDAIVRLDPATGNVVDSFAGGDGAYNALRAFGSMWVTSYAGADVWRFATFR